MTTDTDPERQPREHAVPCTWCRRPTFELEAVCERDLCRAAAADYRARSAHPAGTSAGVYRGRAIDWQRTASSLSAMTRHLRDDALVQSSATDPAGLVDDQAADAHAYAEARRWADLARIAVALELEAAGR